MIAADVAAPAIPPPAPINAHITGIKAGMIPPFCERISRLLFMDVLA